MIPSGVVDALLIAGFFTVMPPLGLTQEPGETVRDPF
jgi:hypothetical protein